METFVLDSSALIAFLNDEEGADKVEDVLQKAKGGNCVVYMNKLNILEIYYGVYRKAGEERAEENGLVGQGITKEDAIEKLKEAIGSFENVHKTESDVYIDNALNKVSLRVKQSRGCHSCESRNPVKRLDSPVSSTGQAKSSTE